MIDTLETQRELLGNAVDAHLAVVNNHMNDIMKKMTSWGAILFGAALISGIYGMNFSTCPSCSWHYGYFIALGSMLALTVVALHVVQAEGLAVAALGASAWPAGSAATGAGRASCTRPTTSMITSSALRTTSGTIAYQRPSIWAWMVAKIQVVSAVTARVSAPCTRLPRAATMAAERQQPQDVLRRQDRGEDQQGRARTPGAPAP